MSQPYFPELSTQIAEMAPPLLSAKATQVLQHWMIWSMMSQSPKIPDQNRLRNCLKAMLTASALPWALPMARGERNHLQPLIKLPDEPNYQLIHPVKDIPALVAYIPDVAVPA